MIQKLKWINESISHIKRRPLFIHSVIVAHGHNVNENVKSIKMSNT